MEGIESIQLSEFFRLFAPRYVLGTTYTLSLAFFESVILPLVDKRDLHGCLLICDRVGFQRATQEANALRSVTKTYSITSAPHRHSFHPKLWLMLNEERLAVLVGSGNLTQSGFMNNLELFEVLQAQKGNGTRPLISDVRRFITGLTRMFRNVKGDDLPAKNILHNIQSELRRVDDATENNPDIRLLSSFDGSFPEQWAIKEKIEQLHIAAPFFGGSLEGITLLKATFRPGRLSVYPAKHEHNELDLPFEKLREMLGNAPTNLKLQTRAKAFAHFKMFGWRTTTGKTFVFTGSPNCTLAALNGLNVEAGVLRPVDTRTYNMLFAAGDKLESPGQLQPDFSVDSKIWLDFWAVNRGMDLELTLLNPDVQQLPLHDVSIEVTSGTNGTRRKYRQLFEPGQVVLLSWLDVLGKTPAESACFNVRIEAERADGKKVVGVSFVDDALSLSSSPVHRNAWKGLSDILSEEVLADPHEVSAVFELFNEMLSDPPEVKHPDHEPSPTKSTEPEVRDVSSQRTAIWPPKIVSGTVPNSSVGYNWSNVAWFQKLLGNLLKTDDGWGDPSGDSVKPVIEDDSEEERTDPKRTKKEIETASEKLWRQAEDNYDQLQAKFHTLLVDEKVAGKVFPVFVAILMSTLGIRRMLVRNGSLPVRAGTTVSLLARFMPLIFEPRKQGLDFVRPPKSPYHSDNYPSVFEDVIQRLGHSIPESLAKVLLGAFAVLKAEADRASAQIFPAIAWAYAGTLMTDARDLCVIYLDEIERIVVRRVLGPDDNIESSRLRQALSDLSSLRVDVLPGFKAFSSLQKIADRPQDNTAAIPELLKVNIPSFIRRVQRKGKADAFLKASRLETRCRASGCSYRGIHNPLFASLMGLMPVICQYCGTASVPALFFDAPVKNESF